MKGNIIRCPCVQCGNIRRQSMQDLRFHLFQYSIDRTYQTWIWHAKEVPSSSSAVRGIERNDIDIDHEDDGSNMVDMINDMEEEFVHRSEEEFKKMMDDVETP